MSNGPMCIRGNDGVISKGVQLGSAMVAALPSRSAFCIASMGRHRPKRRTLEIPGGNSRVRHGDIEFGEKPHVGTEAVSIA